MLRINDVDISNKKVLIRVDFNVPIVNGKIIDTTRIYASIETIKYALDQNAAIILMSHLGDPNANIEEEDQYLSLQIIVPILENILHK